MKARKSWAMAYCGMAAALSVALMLLGAVFPIAMFIAPAVASFLIATVCVECGKTMALTAYGAVSLLSLLFVPDKEVALTFVFLLGYYPLAKPKFERIRPAVLRIVCKLLLCNGTPDTPDIMAVVYCTTGRALDWSPQLSASTGSPVPVEGVDDFSNHPTPGAAS